MIIKALILLFTFPTLAQVEFPVSKEIKAKNSILRVDPEILNNPQCQEFLRYSQEEMNTSSLIVLKSGKSKIELYANEANENTKTKLWSISKLMTGLILGTKVKKYGMQLLDRSLESLGISRSPQKEDLINDWNQVKLRHVWNMSSGLDWCEYANCRATDTAQLLYGKGKTDATKFVLNTPLVHSPGTYYRYSAGNYILLQQALRNISPTYDDYLRLPYTNILKPLGLSPNDYAFESDKKGILLGGSGLSLTARGFAKIGQLILNKGIWNEESLVSPEFYEEMTSNSFAIKNSPFDVQNWEGPAGGSIWLNDDSLNGDGKDRLGIPSFMPNSPYDMIYAGGNFGQFLLIYPTSELVIARIGGDSNHSKHWVKFSNKALKCFDPKVLRSDYQSKVEKKAPETGKSLSIVEALKQNILSGNRAQELCSCLFVSGYKSVKKCDQMVPTKTELFGGVNNHNILSTPVVNWVDKTVSVRRKFSNKKVISKLNLKHPFLGCQLD